MMSDEDCFDLLRLLFNVAKNGNKSNYQRVRDKVQRAMKTDNNARDFFTIMFRGIGHVPAETSMAVHPKTIRALKSIRAVKDAVQGREWKEARESGKGRLT